MRRALLSGNAQKVFLQQDLGARRLGRLDELLSRPGIPIQRVPALELERLTDTAKHQGVAALLPAAAPVSEREAIDLLGRSRSPLALLLDGLQDPRNFGAVLRTANAAGVDLVAYPRNRNVALTPVVSKVAAGAAEHQTMAEVANLARFIEQLTDAGVWVVGADGAAEKSLFDADLTGPVAIVIGAEGEGLRRLTRDRCSSLVRVPMRGTVESLNVAVATGICLYECLRQRLAVARVAPVR